MSVSPVAVIGLGCIGGSLARALKARRVLVRGWSTSPDDCAAARAADLDACAAPLESAIPDAHTVVLAVPMQAIADVAAVVCREAAPDAVIIHCCGVQSRHSLGLDEATFARMFGAHPLAGSHKSGFDAARPELFAGCAVSVESRAPDAVRERMSWLWPLVGATRLDYRPAEEHDALMAWISHLPQLAATALAATLASGDIDPLTVGPGARDSTRLAASAFEQWSSLLGSQPAALDTALERLEGSVASIRAALHAGDQNALRTIWDTARKWRSGAERPR